MPSLHNLQLFLLPHTETLSRSSTTSARLHFLAGPRLIAYLTSTHDQITRVSSTLSCGAPQVPDRVSQVVEERKSAEKRVVDLESQLSIFAAKELLQIVTQVDGRLSAYVHRNDDSLVFLTAIASEFTKLWTASEYASKEHIIVLTSSPTSQTTASLTLILVFGSADAIVKEVGETLKLGLGVKGGGKGSRWSGKWTGVWRPTKEGELVDRAVRGLPT